LLPGTAEAVPKQEQNNDRKNKEKNTRIHMVLHPLNNRLYGAKGSAEQRGQSTLKFPSYAILPLQKQNNCFHFKVLYRRIKQKQLSERPKAGFAISFALDPFAPLKKSHPQK